jgi:hypothetical protein
MPPMMDKIIEVNNQSRGLFLSTREDYVHKIERLVRMITEKYPEVSESQEFSTLNCLYDSGSLHELSDFYEHLYQKVKELNIPSYRPHWVFRTSFYS